MGEVEAPPLAPSDGGAISLDSGAPFDAAVPFDAGPLPTSPGPPLVYVVSTRFWTFNPTNGAWAGGTQLPANNCPFLDELAVDAFGRLFAVGNSGTRLYRVDPSNLTCTALGVGGPGYPQAMSFVPRGTLNAYDEEVVGYVANGDYVRLDTTSGALSLVKAAALAGYTVGDLVNVGPKGYVALSGGALRSWRSSSRLTPRSDAIASH